MFVATRTLLILAIAAAVAATWGLGGAPVARAADIAYVATDVLNVRDVPGVDGAELEGLL